MTDTLFNPFEDRLSRDIRNNLSEGLAEAVETGSTDTLRQTVAYYRQQHLAEYYRAYLEDRYARYTKALEKMHADISDPIHQGVILWNLGLFFEVHEVLERAWYSAEGNMKETLQALIRAAGVYIKQEYGFNDAAGRIAAKAIPVLAANGAILERYFKTETLISALRNPADLPPILA
ncbi:DUF309 domain-containing protein [Desulfocastanea catecholica]